MNTLLKIRKQLIDQIAGMVKKHANDPDDKSIEVDDLTKGRAPVVFKDHLEGNNTEVLEKITIEDGRLIFDSSSASGNQNRWNEDNIATDSLCDIVDFLQKYTQEKDNCDE